MGDSILASLTHAQRQRLIFIETTALWEGIVGRPRVAEVFKIAGNHITRDFATYREACPGNLDYDVSVRAYRPGRNFKPRLTSGSAEEYLSLLRSYVESKSIVVVSSIGDSVAAAALPSPHGVLNRAVLRSITRALRHQQGLRVVYQSLSTPQPTEREIWPHALVFAGVRWHVRAYDAKRGSFIDLNLMRFLDAKPLSKLSPQSSADDLEWCEEVDIDIVPSPKLSVTQQGVIAAEYGMRQIGKAWMWRVRLKRCLAAYFIRWLRLDLDAEASYPLVLRDPNVAKLYRLGNAKSEPD